MTIRRKQVYAVRQKLAATDAQLRAMSAIIPVAALRARLAQRDFDIEALRADVARHPHLIASTVMHGYRDNRDSIIGVRWHDGTHWRKP